MGTLVTRETILMANRRMAEIANDASRGEWDRIGAIGDIYWPLLDKVELHDPPRELWPQVLALGDDLLGQVVEGELVIWGPPKPMAGLERTWREFELIAPQPR